jgi:hypothetical protein
VAVARVGVATFGVGAGATATVGVGATGGVGVPQASRGRKKVSMGSSGLLVDTPYANSAWFIEWKIRTMLSERSTLYIRIPDTYWQEFG